MSNLARRLGRLEDRGRPGSCRTCGAECRACADRATGLDVRERAARVLDALAERRERTATAADARAAIARAEAAAERWRARLRELGG